MKGINLTRLTMRFHEPQVLWEGRNARTGHELAVCAVIRAER
jgi:hypothetical protein